MSKTPTAPAKPDGTPTPGVNVVAIKKSGVDKEALALVSDAKFLPTDVKVEKGDDGSVRHVRSTGKTVVSTRYA